MQAVTHCPVLVVGEPGVGKSCLRHGLANDAKAALNNSKMDIPHIDHVEGAGFGSIENALCYPNIGGFMIVYDVTNVKSFVKAKEWFHDIDMATRIRKYAGIVLVGNKTDCTFGRVVSTAQGKELANSLGIRFIETSAQDSINVMEAFVELTRDCLLRARAKDVAAPLVQPTAQVTTITAADRAAAAKSAVSPMTKQRDLDAIGKTREDVYSFLRDVIRCSPVENIPTFVESLSAKQWHNLLVLVSGDKINRFTTAEWLKDFYTRCPDWRGYAVAMALYLQKHILHGESDKAIIMPDVTDVCIKINARKPRRFLTAFLNGEYLLHKDQFWVAAYGIGRRFRDTYHVCYGSCEEFIARQQSDFACIIDRLHTRPAVLSFLMGQDLHIPGMFSYRGTPSVETERCQFDFDYIEKTFHAVLVGARKEKDTFYFLAQTSLPDKVFVEFSGEYLALSEAQITFVQDTAPMELLMHLGEAGFGWEDEEDEGEESEDDE
eukprot:gene11312-13158_t